VGYEVLFTPGAERQLLALPDEAQARLEPAIEGLADNPRPKPPLGKKLRDRRDRYRLAVGDYRAIYEIHRRDNEVLIVWVGLRRDAYRHR
jgi:mRNA interferase RelE/StbE